MVFKLRPTPSSILRPRITPDPERAAELQRRMMALTYHPENGFHRDLRQHRHDRAASFTLQAETASGSGG